MTNQAQFEFGLKCAEKLDAMKNGIIILVAANVKAQYLLEIKINARKLAHNSNMNKEKRNERKQKITQTLERRKISIKISSMLLESGNVRKATCTSW